MKKCELSETCADCGGAIQRSPEKTWCPCDVRLARDMARGGAPIPNKWLPKLRRKLEEDPSSDKKRLIGADGHRSPSYGVLFNEDGPRRLPDREPGSLFDSRSGRLRRRRRGGRR